MQTLRSCDGAGHTLLSGSDDTRLGIWDVDTKKLKKSLRTGHHANIFCTRYMPGTGSAILPVMLLCSSNVVLAAFAMGCTHSVGLIAWSCRMFGMQRGHPLPETLERGAPPIMQVA